MRRTGKRRVVRRRDGTIAKGRLEFVRIRVIARVHEVAGRLGAVYERLYSTSNPRSVAISLSVTPHFARYVVIPP